MTISPRDLFEIALVVPDLEAAMKHFHEAFGYTFSPILEGVLPMEDADGEHHRLPLRMVVTREVVPQLELVEAQPGTALEAPAGTGLHHLGYYVDDLAAESTRLASMGFPLDCAGTANGDPPDGWVYHQMPDGTIIELVDRESAPLRKMLTEGSMPDSPLASRLVPPPPGLGGP